MRIRPIIVLGIAALIAPIGLVVLKAGRVTPVPSDRFIDTLHKEERITIVSQVTRAPEPMPLALRMRFPRQSRRGGHIGFTDRTDVYVLDSGHGNVEFAAHVRGGRVCHVTMSRNDGSGRMRATIEDLFPGLPVR